MYKYQEVAHRDFDARLDHLDSDESFADPQLHSDVAERRRDKTFNPTNHHHLFPPGESPFDDPAVRQDRKVSEAEKNARGQNTTRAVLGTKDHNQNKDE